MKKILLTGSNGFVGSNLLEELSKKYKVFCITRSKKKNKIQQNIFSINPNDLKNILEKNKFYSIIHCATHYKKTHLNNDIDQMINSNIHLGNLILENKNTKYCKKFINFTTVWENYNGLRNNPFNLYSAYKLAFSNILKFYTKKLNTVKFYNLYLSETFGKNDNRKKLFSTLKDNYNKQKKSIIVSKNLKINVLNVKDIISAVNILLKKNIKPNNYSVLNSKEIDILNLIKLFNKQNEKKIIYEYNSSKLIKEKLFNYKRIPGWKPKYSLLQDLLNYIKN